MAIRLLMSFTACTRPIGRLSSSACTSLPPRPQLPRRQRGRRARPKREYEFLVRYKYLPLSSEEGSENPSWQPWSFVRHLTALRDYCSLPLVENALGDDFYVEESVDPEED